MDKYDYKAIAAAKTLLEQALELVQEARESLDGADAEVVYAIEGDVHCSKSEECIKDALEAMYRGMHGKDLAEAKLEMVIDRCRELHGNVNLHIDLMCSLCEYYKKPDGPCENCIDSNGMQGFELRNPWEE